MEKLKYLILMILIFLLVECSKKISLNKPVQVEDKKININHKYKKKISKKYIKAMIDYNKRRYGIEHAHLVSPEIIVIHASHVKGLDKTLQYFTNDLIQLRPDIQDGGNVNIGAHFIVDSDGTIYSFIPLKFTARHIIGYNYTAIGIENVGARNQDLTTEQLDSNILLIHYLLKKYDSIKYLIGHHEYLDRTMPHYKLIRRLDKTYQPTWKTDPGREFINLIRKKLKREGISLLD